MIVIRADANREIGTGHVMRCLSIAAALKKLGHQVCFLTADQGAVPLLLAKGQAYRVLDSDYRDLEGELAILERLFSNSGQRDVSPGQANISGKASRAGRAFSHREIPAAERTVHHWISSWRTVISSRRNIFGKCGSGCLWAAWTTNACPGSRWIYGSITIFLRKRPCTPIQARSCSWERNMRLCEKNLPEYHIKFGRKLPACW